MADPVKPKRKRGSPGKESPLRSVHHEWLVIRFAQHGVRELFDDFEAEFGFPITRQTAARYNMNGIRDAEHAVERSKSSNPDHLELHRRARAEYEASIADIPVASAVYRVKQLDKMFHEAMGKRNFRMAASLLEQAAKESGGAYSNRRVLDGSIEHKHEYDVPQEIMRDVLAGKIREVIADGLKARAAIEQTKALPAAEAVIDG